MIKTIGDCFDIKGARAMKRLASLILLKICLISFLLTAPAGAAISPCNQMTGSVSPDGSSVTLVVYDPKVNGNWIYMYSMGTSITNFNISNGIARWCEGAQSPYDGYIVHVLFDPNRGWRLTQSNIIYNLDSNTLTEANGVVSAEGSYHVYYSTYDPFKGEWVSVDSSVNYTPFLVNKDGIVAFFSDHETVSCDIYDNTIFRGWKKKIFDPANTFSVEQACVKIEYTYWGYNPYIGVWQEGVTQSKAFFYADPTRGKPPLWVWFWDLSLGAVIKQWTFGDGTSVYGGSCSHNYPKVGTYTVTQLVAGYPGGGADAASKPIYVGMGQGIPAIPLLLLD